MAIGDTEFTTPGQRRRTSQVTPFTGGLQQQLTIPGARPERAAVSRTTGETPVTKAPTLGRQQPKVPTQVPTQAPSVGGFRPSGNPLADLSSMMTGPASQQKIKSIIDTLVAAYPGRARSLGSSARGVWDKISIDGMTYDFVLSASATGGSWNTSLQPEGATGGGGGAISSLFGGGQTFEDPLSQAFMDSVRKRIGQLESPAATPELDRLMQLLKQTQSPSAINAPTREQIMGAGDPLQAAFDFTRQIHRQLLRRDPTQAELDAWGAGIVYGSVTPDALVNQLLRDNPTAQSTLELEGTPYDTLAQTLRGQLKPTEGFDDLLKVLAEREASLRKEPGDVGGLQAAIDEISKQFSRAQLPPDLAGLQNLLSTTRQQASVAGDRPQEALSAEQQLMDLLQGRVDELGKGPTATTLAAQEAQAFDALSASRDASLGRLAEEAQRRGIAPGSGVMLAAQAEAERGFGEIQAQQQQALILRRHEEEQLRAQEQIATAGDLATVTQMREQAELERDELERNLLRQVDLLEEEGRARLDAQEDRARDLAIQRSELQRALQDRIDARQREIVDVTGLRADIEERERQRRVGVAGQLFGLEDLGTQRQLSNAQNLAALEQTQEDRDNTRLDQIMNLQSIFPEMGRQALSDALAVLGLGSVQNSGISNTLLQMAQVNSQQGVNTNAWLSQLGAQLGQGTGLGGFGGLSGFRPQEPAAA